MWIPPKNFQKSDILPKIPIKSFFIFGSNAYPFISTIDLVDSKFQFNFNPVPRALHLSSEQSLAKFSNSQILLVGGYDCEEEKEGSNRVKIFDYQNKAVKVLSSTNDFVKASKICQFECSKNKDRVFMVRNESGYFELYSTITNTWKECLFLDHDFNDTIFLNEAENLRMIFYEFGPSFAN